MRKVRTYLEKWFARFRTTAKSTAITLFFAFATNVFGASGPAALNISGTLFDVSGAPLASPSVEFTLEIYDKTGTCLLFSENHLAQDLSNTKGGFSLELGKGSNASNLIDGAHPAALTSKVFENVGVIAGGWTGCSSGATLADGDERVIRVRYDTGGGLVTMNPDVPIASAAYSIVAETLQGKRPADFLQVHDDVSNKLTQANVENVFSSSNYPKLDALLQGSSTQYISSTPATAVNFNAQRIVNVADPNSAQDVATKNYSDSYIGGKIADLSGVGPALGDGYTLIWDKDGQQWTTGMPSATDNSKLPLTGGAMNGNIDMSGYDILNTGHVTMSPQRVFNLGTFDHAQEMILIGTLTAAQKGASWYDSEDDVLKIWNGANAISQAYLSSGKLDASWLPPSVMTTAMVAGGDLTGTYPNPTIANDKILSSMIDHGGVGINRLIISDQTTGTGLRFATCSLNEVLRYEAANGWICRDPNAIVTFPVTKVNGKTGDITLEANDLGLGTAAAENIGTNPGDIPQLDGSGKIPSALLHGSAGGSAGGDLTGTYPNPSIANNAVTGAKIADGAITTAKLFTNPGVNRLVATDATTGGSLMFFSCVSGQTMQWIDDTNGWGCVSVSTLPGDDYIVNGGNSLTAPISLGTNDSNPLSLRTNGTDHLTVDASGYVGIGTTSPTAKLDVAGTFKLSNGTEALGRVLTSDSSGLATWADAPATVSCPMGFTSIEGSGKRLGCISTSESNSGSPMTWHNATNYCGTTYGGRLPTWAEWYFATNNYALTGETNNYEWTSDVTNNYTAMKVGNGGLTIGLNDSMANASVFRCFIPGVPGGQTVGGDGTVTSITASDGLSGGTITGSGTIGLNAIASHTLLANATAGTAVPSSTTLSALIDSSISNTQGAILFRNASGWAALTPGASGQFLKTQGAGAAPAWASTGSGSVTSVNMTVPSFLSLSGAPVTSSGTLAVSLVPQSAGTVFAGPTGGSSTPTFRALASSDIPNLDASKVTTGMLDMARLGSGTADNTTYLRGDGTWAIPSSGDSGDFMKDGSVAMIGNIRLNGHYLSGDGGSEGVYVNNSGYVGVGNSSPSALFSVGSSSQFQVNTSGVVSTPSLLATGIMDGTTPITFSTTTSLTLGGAYKSGYTFNNYSSTSAAITYTLPAAATGLQYCVRNYTGKTGTLRVNTSGSGQYIDVNGVNTASGGYVISGGALGDSACFVGVDSTHWVMYQNLGTWTKN